VKSLTGTERKNLKPGDRLILHMEGETFHGTVHPPAEKYREAILVRFDETDDMFHTGHGVFSDKRGYYVTSTDLRMWSFEPAPPPSLKQDLEVLWSSVL
jgi:hypothetical protein